MAVVDVGSIGMERLYSPPLCKLVSITWSSFRMLLISVSRVHSALLFSLARFLLISLGSLLRIIGVRREPYASDDLPNEDSPLT